MHYSGRLSVVSQMPPTPFSTMVETMGVLDSLSVSPWRTPRSRSCPGQFLDRDTLLKNLSDSISKLNHYNYVNYCEDQRECVEFTKQIFLLLVLINRCDITLSHDRARSELRHPASQPVLESLSSSASTRTEWDNTNRARQSLGLSSGLSRWMGNTTSCDGQRTLSSIHFYSAVSMS